MSKRFDRANSQIQKSIAKIIQFKMNDPRLNPMLFISEVEVTPDFKYCKVKVALDSKDEKELEDNIKILQCSQGFIKKELANMLKMPSIPQLNFVADKGTSATIRINEILSHLNIPKEESEGEDKDE